MTDFEQVYRDYFRDVELYLLALCKDQHLAEELTAQTFFQVMKALPQFRGEYDIRTWLWTIGRNRYLDYIKRAGEYVARRLWGSHAAGNKWCTKSGAVTLPRRKSNRDTLVIALPPSPGYSIFSKKSGTSSECLSSLIL